MRTLLKSVFITLVCCCVSVASAAPVSVNQARTIAQQFVGTPQFSPGTSGAVPQTLTLSYVAKTSKQMNACYVFNRGVDGGYVVVSGDDRTPAILGYSDTGSFNYNDIPCNFEWWLNEYVREIEALQSNPALSRSPRLTSLPNTINPIMPSIHWHQRSPFNDQCPTYSGSNHCVAGCVSIALSQIMFYHKYPAQGQGSISYKTRINDSGDSIYLSANFANSTYQWNNMLGTYLSSATSTQKSAVAQLVKDVGYACKTTYRSGNSTASSDNAHYAMLTYFGYDKIANCLQRDYFVNNTEWDKMIYNELLNGRPVYYSGTVPGANVGHAFVIDGCKTTGYFHVNWGWNNGTDGYFLSTSLNPATQGDGGTAGGYNKSQYMITGLRRNVGGAEGCWGLIEKVTPQSSYTKRGSTVTFDFTYFGVRRSTHSDASAYVGLGLYDQNDNLKYVQYSRGMVSPMKYNYVYTWTFDFTIPTSLAKGTYKLKPVYSLTGTAVGNAQPMHVKFDKPQYVIVVNNATGAYNEVLLSTRLDGDVNGDGNVNVSDVTALINMILGVIPKDLVSGDINGDGNVNVSDVTALVNLILS